MGEFTPNPEAKKAELLEIDKAVAETDNELMEIREGLESGEIEEAEFGRIESELSAKAEKIKKQSLALLVELGDNSQIEQRLRDFADSVVEMMGEDMPISQNEMLYSVFGVTSVTDTIPDSLSAIIEDLSTEYLILPDEDAEENEHFLPDNSE